MNIIDLRDFYPWYRTAKLQNDDRFKAELQDQLDENQDGLVAVSDEVLAELAADRRYQKSHERRMRRNKVYSLDVRDGTVEMASAHNSDKPEVLLEQMERYCRLCHALNTLPELQGRRVEAYYLLGKSQKEIADAEGVSESTVSESITRGLRAMRKNFQNNFDPCPDICH